MKRTCKFKSYTCHLFILKNYGSRWHLPGSDNSTCSKTGGMFICWAL